MKFRQISVALLTSCSLLLLSLSAIRLEDNFNQELKVGEQIVEMGQMTTKTCNILPKKSSNRFMLVHFWASYNAESRVENIRWNKFFNETVSDKIGYRAVSLDLDKAIYEQTLAIDGIEDSSQLWVQLSRRNEVIGRYALDNSLHTYLVDENGLICLVDPSLEELNHFYHL